MKLRIILFAALAAFLIAPAVRCQTDSAIHVNQFPGLTVGDKVSAAMKTCPAVPTPCYLILDASLANAATGTIPSLPSNAQLVDFRTTWPGNGANAPVSTNGLVTGGGVVWDGGLNFTISAASYYIGGVLLTSQQTNVTLAGSDPTNPRIDEFYVDSSGLAGVITGTPAPTPSTPSPNPITQIGLGSALIPAGATSPSGVSTLPIYRDNADWTCTASEPSFDCASTNSPYKGTYNIYFDSSKQVLSDDSVDLTGSVNLANYTSLTFFIKDDSGNWPNGASLLIAFSGPSQFYKVVLLSNGVYGFSTANSNWQQITIPVSAFGTGSNTVTDLAFGSNGLNLTGKTITLHLDEIYLQSGLSGGCSGSGCSTSIANSSFTVGTTAMSAATCTAAATVSMPGVTASTAFSISPSADISGVTGWGSSGGLVVDSWPTTNTFNYKVCNQSTNGITPSASVSFNVGAK